MKKKKQSKIVEFYTCKWCNAEKKITEFYRNNADICKECINIKFNEIFAKQGKLKAYLMCCHYLNVPFDVAVINGINDFNSFGDYLKKFNLMQNRGKTFEESVIDFGHLKLMNDERIERISKIVENLNDDLQKLRGELK